VLQAGQVDLVAASMTHKKDRDGNNDFTQTYFLDGQALLVKDGSGIQGLEDLGGKTVASVQGSTSIQNIQKAIETLKLDTETLELQTYTDAAQALVDGRADAVTTDASILAGLAANNPGLVIVGRRFSQEPYGMGVPQFDPTWRDLVNFTLQELFADGTYAEIYAKWLGQEDGYIKYPADMFAVEVWPGTNYVTAAP
jgi:polar amino acid transport system substrate-binding protein